MSDIVLSASVRQNLLSLQSTAELLSTTQNRLATGNKVNTALDNPTNYFTAQSLNNRSSDINNLLDSVSNGVQVLQAANTGITSLQKLIDSAKSVANQALQAAVGYSQKSTVTTTAIPGATADDLRGTGTGYTNNTVAGTELISNTTATYTSATASDAAAVGSTLSAYTAGTTTGSPLLNDNTGTAVAITGNTLLSGTPGAGSDDLGTAIGTSDTLTVTVGSTTTTITFNSGSGTTGTVAGNDLSIDITTGTVQDILDAVNTATGGTSSIDTSGAITLTSSVANDFTLGGSVATSLGLSTTAVTRGGNAPTVATVDAATKLAGAASQSTTVLGTPLTDGSSFTINGKTISFSSSAATAITTTGGNSTINLGTGTIQDVLDSINGVVGSGAATIDGTGKISIASGTASALTVADGATGALAALGLAGLDGNSYGTAGATPTNDVTGATRLAQTAGSTSNGLGTAFTTTDTITANGKTIAFYDSGTGGAAGADADTVYEDLASATIQDVLGDIDTITGAATPSSVVAGKVTLSTGTTSSLDLGGTGLAKLGLATGTTARAGTAPGLDGLTLNIAATGSGTATAITFGDGSAGTVKSLNDLNAKLQSNNLLATIDSSGKLTITTTNDAASSTIGAITGTATDADKAFNGLAGGDPVKSAAAQAVRSNLVDQYNNILDQIKTTAQDASYNGIDLLNGDQLKLTFNETGTSTLKIQGVVFDYAGLGLSKLAGGTDFIDNASANDALASLDKASSSLRTEASALGSNLSIVQIRQDFSKNLINVLQTGASNLTLADTNEEAANSQALSTRQSIAVSALALANQSQQSVLQLLR